MAAFTAGNVVVYRIGGTTSAAAPAFLDEYTPQGVLVQEIALPTSTVGANDALTGTGQATYSGEISESANGASILIARYDATPGTTGVSSAANIPRVVGIVSAAGTIDTTTTTTALTGRFTSAASSDGKNIYVASANGVGYTTDGSSSAPISLTTNAANQVSIANGQLYYSASSPATPGIYQLGTGLPTGANQTSTLIASTSAGTKPEAFAFATLGSGPAPDTLYVADNVNGIEKFSFSNNAWALTGKVSLPGAAGVSVSVAGSGSTAVATLYVTGSTAASPPVSTLQSIVDSSGQGGTLSATPTVLATAISGSVFKGDAFAPSAVCYCTGTLIRTDRGNLAVENLSIGYLVVTASGAVRPIKWIGHRAYAARFANANPDLLPICIKTGAISENVPARDLWVSPKHALFLDGILIPAASLLNGVSILKSERIDHDLNYWHVELDTHDVIIAENTPAESFVDDNGRGIFHNARTFRAMYPDAVETEAVYCAPRVEAGHLVAEVKRRLAKRAGLPVSAAEFGALSGNVDICNGVVVAGWARDAMYPDAPVCLDILVDGTLVAMAYANQYRQDLRLAGLGDGRHGFSISVNMAPGSAHVVEIRRSADGSQLNGSPFHFSTAFARVA